jgi:hypothetical protein
MHLHSCVCRMWDFFLSEHMLLYILINASYVATLCSVRKIYFKIFILYVLFSQKNLPLPHHEPRCHGTTEHSDDGYTVFFPKSFFSVWRHDEHTHLCGRIRILMSYHISTLISLAGKKIIQYTTTEWGYYAYRRSKAADRI